MLQSQTQWAKIIVTEVGNELILGLDFCRIFSLVIVAEMRIHRQTNVCQHRTIHITDELDVDYNHLRQKWKQHLPLGKHTGDFFGGIKARFTEMFDDKVGLFDGEVELRAELDQMERKEIIFPYPEMTDCVHNFVIASKKNGDIKVRLDPKNLNEYLIRSVHHTESWEGVSTSFAKDKFSTIDAKNGYWSKKLISDSQLLIAFNTSFKTYYFIHLPFGLSIFGKKKPRQASQALSSGRTT